MDDAQSRQLDRRWKAQLRREQLHFAAQDGDLTKVKELLAVGFPLNRFDEIGHTPLHYAVMEDHLDVARHLLEAGADPNANCEQTIGNTPLADGIATCSFEMAELLVRHGADPTIRGWMQLNAIDRVRDRKDPGRFLRLFGVK